MIQFKDYKTATLLFVKEELPHLPLVGDYINYNGTLFLVKERGFKLDLNIIGIYVSRCES